MALVSAGNSSNYEELEKEILKGHEGCTRVQPIAVPNPNPTANSYCQGIARLLKEENCMVYIIWSGSLEKWNGVHSPPIKKLYHSLTQHSFNGNSKARSTGVLRNIMHRLFFVQLGGKGLVDRVVLNSKCTQLFWKIPEDDNTFDVKECGEHIRNMVRKRLDEVRLEYEAALNELDSTLHHNGHAQESYDITDGAESEMLLSSASSKQKPPSKRTLDVEEFADKVADKVVRQVEKMNEKKDAKLIKHMDGQFEEVKEKLDQNNLEEES